MKKCKRKVKAIFYLVGKNERKEIGRIYEDEYDERSLSLTYMILDTIARQLGYKVNVKVIK